MQAERSKAARDDRFPGGFTYLMIRLARRLARLFGGRFELLFVIRCQLAAELV
jgi:hypothetical protein